MTSDGGAVIARAELMTPGRPASSMVAPQASISVSEHHCSSLARAQAQQKSVWEEEEEATR